MRYTLLMDKKEKSILKKTEVLLASFFILAFVLTVLIFTLLLLVLKTFANYYAFLSVAIIAGVILLLELVYFIISYCYGSSLMKASLLKDYQKCISISSRLLKIAPGSAKQSIYASVILPYIFLDDFPKARNALSKIKKENIKNDVIFARIILLLEDENYIDAKALYIVSFKKPEALSNPDVVLSYQALGAIFKKIESGETNPDDEALVKKTEIPFLERLYATKKEAYLIPVNDEAFKRINYSSTTASTPINDNLQKQLRIWAWVAFWFSIVGLIIFFIVLSFLGFNTLEANPTSYLWVYFWVFFILSIIPLTSAILGIVLKKTNKESKSTKFIVVGIIFFLLYLVNGAFSTTDTANHDYNVFLNDYSSLLKLSNIPTKGSAASYTYATPVTLNSESKVKSEITLVFNNEQEIADLDNEISKSSLYSDYLTTEQATYYTDYFALYSSFPMTPDYYFVSNQSGNSYTFVTYLTKGWMKIVNFEYVAA
jgi:hypothetical protein